MQYVFFGELDVILYINKIYISQLLCVIKSIMGYIEEKVYSYIILHRKLHEYPVRADMFWHW